MAVSYYKHAAIKCCPYFILQITFRTEIFILKIKVKAVCGSYSTAALRHIVLLPE